MKNKYRKLICMGMSVLLTLSSTPMTTTWAEETVTPEEVVVEQPVMEEEVSGTGEVSAEGFQYNELADGTLEITGYDGSDKKLVVPAEIDGKRVTSIGNSAFDKYRSMLSIELPSGITNIGDSAFFACRYLTSIELPSSLVSIGKQAFASCYGLTSIELPSSLTSIGDEAFSYCNSLTDIEFPSGVTSIGNRLFEWSSSLTNISVDENNETYSSLDGVLFNKQKTVLYSYPAGRKGPYQVPSGVTHISNGAFSSCKGLTDIELPSSVEVIEERAFSSCKGLKNIELPSKVTSIEEDVFSYCEGLTSIKLPSGLLVIGDSAFSYCKALTSVELPSRVIVIKHWAFLECGSLTDIELPSRLEVIGDSAFSGCGSLTSIELPSGLRSIGDSAFSGCDSLINLSIDENNEKYSSLDGVLFNKQKTELIGYPAGKNGPYQVPSGVTSIGGGAFYGCSNLTSIELPSGVTSIGMWAFRRCSSLTGIEMPSGVTNIGWYAFEGCSGLTSIKVPSGVTSIGNGMFAGCSNLTSVELPDVVNKIGDDAFSECSSLTSIEMPEEVTSIGGNAFRDCSSLISIELPDKVTSIGGNAFSECSSLISIEMPEEVTSIGQYAFFKCDKITIICEENSYAHTYAVENNIPFQFMVKYTITLDANGGTALNRTSFRIKEGEILGELPTPIRTGYTFKGWFTAKTDGIAVTKDTTATADMTIYAQWVQIKNENGSGKPGNEPGGTSDNPQQKQSLAKAAVTIAKTNYAYNGKAKVPKVSVVLKGKTLAANTDYIVIYRNNKNIGTATVTITGIGNYTGTISKTFTIRAKKGTSFTVGAYKYKITSSKEAAFAGIKSAKTKKVVIPKTVKIGGKTFKVTSVAKKALYKKAKVTSVTISGNVKTIGAYAFTGCKKLSTITINTTKLKSVGKNAFKGIKTNAKIKVPSKKLKAYKKVLKKKGQGRKVKIVKK